MAASSALLWWHLNRAIYDGITIAIVQTASHPALDTVRVAFQERIEHALAKPVRFLEYNAQSSVSQAHIIAQQLHARSDVDGIVALGTMAAQVISQAEQEKPICFAAVTDPQSAGILGPNVCGASDSVASEHVRQLVQELLPQVKTVALLFNASEKNATVMAERLITQMSKHGYTIVPCAVASEVELAAAVVHACRLDVIICPIDNMVASTVSFIAQRALEARTPFIVSDVGLVSKGPLAGVGVDYRQIGIAAAECMIKVLTQKIAPNQIPIVYPTVPERSINQAIARQLGCPIPETITAHII